MVDDDQKQDSRRAYHRDVVELREKVEQLTAALEAQSANAEVFKAFLTSPLFQMNFGDVVDKLIFAVSAAVTVANTKGDAADVAKSTHGRAMAALESYHCWIDPSRETPWDKLERERRERKAQEKADMEAFSKRHQTVIQEAPKRAEADIPGRPSLVPQQ